MNTAAEKPIVKFKTFHSFYNWPDGDKTATLWGVSGHPKLVRSERVYTSKVIEVDDWENPIRIETMNTIYVKE